MQPDQGLLALCTTSGHQGWIFGPGGRCKASSLGLYHCPNDLNSDVCVSVLQPRDMMSCEARGSVGVSVGTGRVWGREPQGRLPVLPTGRE